MLETVARQVGRRPVVIIVVWSVAAVLAVLLSGDLTHKLSGGGWRVASAESTLAAQAQDSGFVGRGSSTVTLLIHDRRFPVTAPEFATRARTVYDSVRSAAELRVSNDIGWTSLSGAAAAPFTGKDQHTVAAILDLGIDEGAAKREVPAVQDRLQRFTGDGIDATLVGQSAAYGAVNRVSADGLVGAEALVLPILIVVLLLVYRSVAAAVLSVLAGVSAVVLTMGALSLIADHLELSVFVQNVASMLGLGVGVDYGLIMIRRFMEELDDCGDRRVATARTLRTAGRVVATSGATIVAAVTTLLLVGVSGVRSMALGGMLAVTFATLTSLILLPAALLLLGPRINALRIPIPVHAPDDSSRWYRFALWVQARPVRVLLVGCGTLVLLALPAAHLRTFNADASVLPASDRTRAGYLLAEEQFGRGSVEPITVVMRKTQPFTGAQDLGALATFIQHVERSEQVQQVNSPLTLLALRDPAASFATLASAGPDSEQQRLLNHFVAADGRTIVFDVIPDNEPADPATHRLVSEIRSLASEYRGADTEILIGGDSADGMTATDEIRARTPLVLALMLVMILLLLGVAFRSVFVPVKAVVLNLLSVAATLGILVTVFQDGHSAGLLGVASVGPIQNFVPLLLFTVLFSLSTDYEVFLIERIRERFRATGDSRHSVAHGLSRTAPLISAAAIIMVLVFAAFSRIPLATVQQLGIGMAIAVAIDATLVRMLLVPAAMGLMGKWNWWLPNLTRTDRT